MISVRNNKGQFRLSPHFVRDGRAEITRVVNDKGQRGLTVLYYPPDEEDGADRDSADMPGKWTGLKWHSAIAADVEGS
jgi:hypothetical protein